MAEILALAGQKSGFFLFFGKFCSRRLVSPLLGGMLSRATRGRASQLRLFQPLRAD